MDDIEYKSLKVDDIDKKINDWEDKSHKTDSRDSSFDYCYNYFHPSSKNNLSDNIEKSCLAIGFYLANWGMFRNSFLLNKSILHYVPLVEYIDKCVKNHQNYWKIDVDKYDNNIGELLEIYNNIKSKIICDKHADLTLVTKIMHGVFGSVPAYDNNFTNYFKQISPKCKFTSFNYDSLKFINQFYKANSDEIDKLSTKLYVFDFRTQIRTNLNYPKARIIDIYGFTKGFRI